MHKAPAKGLVDLRGDELTDLLDDILAGEPAEEDKGGLCPDTPPRTVEESFARLHPLAAQLLAPAPAGQDPFAEDRLGGEAELVLDDSFEVPPVGAAAPEAAAEEPEPLLLDDSLVVPPVGAAAPEAAAEEPEPLLLDDSLVVPPVGAAAPEAVAEEPEPLLLDDSLVVLQAGAAAPEAVAEEPEPLDDSLAEQPGGHGPAADLGAAIDPAALAARVEELLGPAGPAGTTELPANMDALAQLLADIPPGNDFAALDLLYSCWPKTTTRSRSRVLLAVAVNLASTFGLPHKLPMAMAKAWRMLDPEFYEDGLAARLSAIADFIFGWQKEQKIFLILEFGEIELIEYLFESLPPGRHLDRLAAVMNFKVLSNRRMGLVRRIPNRLRKQVQSMLPAGKEAALVELAHAKALLEAIGAPNGFAPIVEAAGKAREEMEKLMKQTAAGVPSPGGAAPGGGQPLGRIG